MLYLPVRGGSKSPTEAHSIFSSLPPLPEAWTFKPSRSDFGNGRPLIVDWPEMENLPNWCSSFWLESGSSNESRNLRASNGRNGSEDPCSSRISKLTPDGRPEGGTSAGAIGGSPAAFRRCASCQAAACCCWALSSLTHSVALCGS